MRLKHGWGVCRIKGPHSFPIPCSLVPHIHWRIPYTEPRQERSSTAFILTYGLWETHIVTKRTVHIRSPAWTHVCNGAGISLQRRSLHCKWWDWTSQSLRSLLPLNLTKPGKTNRTEINPRDLPRSLGALAFLLPSLSRQHLTFPSLMQARI